MTFADKVKKLRKLLGDVTQAKLAKTLKVSQGTIACWETGVSECRPAMLDKLDKLCVKKSLKINWRK